MSAVDLFGDEHARPAAMGSHQRHDGGADEWLTPPDLIDALGFFDLDPCAPITRPWPTAHRHYTLEDDGLRQDWHGRVWLNPPYSTAARWLNKRAKANSGAPSALVAYGAFDAASLASMTWPGQYVPLTANERTAR